MSTTTTTTTTTTTDGVTTTTTSTVTTVDDPTVEEVRSHRMPPRVRHSAHRCMPSEVLAASTRPHTCIRPLLLPLAARHANFLAFPAALQGVPAPAGPQGAAFPTPPPEELEKLKACTALLVVDADVDPDGLLADAALPSTMVLSFDSDEDTVASLVAKIQTAHAVHGFPFQTVRHA